MPSYRSFIPDTALYSAHFAATTRTTSPSAVTWFAWSSAARCSSIVSESAQRERVGAEGEEALVPGESAHPRSRSRHDGQ